MYFPFDTGDFEVGTFGVLTLVGLPRSGELPELAIDAFLLNRGDTGIFQKIVSAGTSSSSPSASHSFSSSSVVLRLNHETRLVSGLAIATERLDEAADSAGLTGYAGEVGDTLRLFRPLGELGELARRVEPLVGSPRWSVGDNDTACACGSGGYAGRFTVRSLVFAPDLACLASLLDASSRSDASSRPMSSKCSRSLRMLLSPS